MKKQILDLAGACVSMAIFGIALAYPGQVMYRLEVMGGAGLAGAVWIFLAVRDRDERAGEKWKGEEESEKKRRITEVVLLSEEDTERMVWNLYGRTAAVIGRDVGENQVDIDLSGSPYASMVEIEHAVLNFSGGNWYVEDLGSVNGLSVKKAGDGRIYQLSQDVPCRLEQGDCLYVDMNRLLLR